MADNPAADSVTRTVETEVYNRRQELRDGILRNLEVARLNLRDTQLSPDAAIVEFYEGVTLTLSCSDEFREADFLAGSRVNGKDIASALAHFEAAGKLVYSSDPAALQSVAGDDAMRIRILTAFWTVGFHAQYNAIVLTHRQLELRLRNGKEAVKANAYKEFREIASSYNKLYRDVESERFDPARDVLIGVAIAALCGRIACLCSQWRIARDQEISAEASVLQHAIRETRGIIQSLIGKSGTRGDSNRRLLESSIHASLEALCTPVLSDEVADSTDPDHLRS